MASNEVGLRVQRIRNDAKLNQRDFGARLGTSSGRISEIESGKSVPGGEFLIRLHQEFNADVTYILTGETQRERAAQLAATPNAYAVDAVREIHGREEVASPPAKGTPPAPTRDELARGTRADPDWPLVMEWVYDALNARKLRMPNGKKLRELVDAVLVLLRLEEGELDREKTRRKIDAIL